MSNRFIKRWKQEGPIYCWRYLENIKNYPGWHLTADPHGVTSFLKLLEYIERDDYTSASAITITAPTPEVLRVPSNKGGKAKWESPKKLKIKLNRDETETEQWILAENDGNLVLTIGISWLQDLRKGIEGISKGEGDYCIGMEMSKTDDDCLWFWWYIS